MILGNEVIEEEEKLVLNMELLLSMPNPSESNVRVHSNGDFPTSSYFIPLEAPKYKNYMIQLSFSHASN